MSQGHERSYEPSPLSQTWLLFLPSFSSRNKGAIYSFRDNDITHARAAVFRRLLQYKHLSLLLFTTKFCAVACVSFGFSQLGQKKQSEVSLFCTPPCLGYISAIRRSKNEKFFLHQRVASTAAATLHYGLKLVGGVVRKIGNCFGASALVLPLHFCSFLKKG